MYVFNVFLTGMEGSLTKKVHAKTQILAVDLLDANALLSPLFLVSVTGQAFRFSGRSSGVA